MDGHDAHRVLPAPGEGGRWDLGELEPGVELPRRTSRPEAELVGEVADVVDGSEHVGLARATLLPFLLEPREPARLPHDFQADVGHGQGPQPLASAPEHVAGPPEAGRGWLVPIEAHRLESSVHRTLGRGVKHKLRPRSQLHEVVGTKLEHL